MLKFNYLRNARKLLSGICLQEQRLQTINSTRYVATSLNEQATNDLESKTSTKPKTPVQFPTFSVEEQHKILKILNTDELQDLLNYNITKAQATKLLAWKKRNGSLEHAEDILNVEGFSMKKVEKFYRSLLDDPTSNEAKKPTRIRTAPFITPTLDAEQQQAIRSCVSVRIGVSSVTWARLEIPPATEQIPCELTDWQHHEILERKLHLNDLVQRCLYVEHQIPFADCYLFENPQMAQASNNPGNVDQQNVNIQKAQMIAMLSFALHARARGLKASQQVEVDEKKMSPGHSNVFYLRRFLSARLFRQLVGTERVSSEDTILGLMRTYYNVEALLDEEHQQEQQPAEERLNFRGNVQFPRELREMYSRAQRHHREFMAQALLLNLAFVRLVLLQDAESVAIVTRGGKK